MPKLRIPDEYDAWDFDVKNNSAAIHETGVTVRCLGPDLHGTRYPSPFLKTGLPPLQFLYSNPQFTCSFFVDRQVAGRWVIDATNTWGTEYSQNLIWRLDCNRLNIETPEEQTIEPRELDRETLYVLHRDLCDCLVLWPDQPDESAIRPICAIPTFVPLRTAGLPKHDLLSVGNWFGPSWSEKCYQLFMDSPSSNFYSYLPDESLVAVEAWHGGESDWQFSEHPQPRLVNTVIGATMVWEGIPRIGRGESDKNILRKSLFGLEANGTSVKYLAHCGSNSRVRPPPPRNSETRYESFLCTWNINSSIPYSLGQPQETSSLPMLARAKSHGRKDESTQNVVAPYRSPREIFVLQTIGIDAMLRWKGFPDKPNNRVESVSIEVRAIGSIVHSSAKVEYGVTVETLDLFENAIFWMIK